MKSGLDRDSEVREGDLIVNLPRSAVIYLRSNSGTRDLMRIVIRTEEGETGLPVHVLKVASYSLDDIFEKRLFMLLPFYIFNYEKQFKEMEENEQKRDEMIKTFKSIIERLRSYVPTEEETGNIDELIDTYAINSIIEYIKKVVSNLAKGYPNVKEGVMSVMGGRIFTYEAKRIKDAGREEGVAIGEARGEARGEDKLGKLIDALYAAQREADVRKAATDTEYRKQLFAELNIV